MNQRDKAIAFFRNPDSQSLAKSRFAAYYFGLYLKIIKSVRDRFKRNSRIVYLDLFSGAGKYGTGTESVPLKVLSSAKGISNIYFHFNDLFLADQLEENIKEKFHFETLPSNIVVTKEDAQALKIKRLFNSDDIVLSYVDSFGYKLCDVNTINQLISNPFSDILIFLNTEHFYRFIDYGNEKPSYIKFFGSEENFNHFQEEYAKEPNKDKVTLELIRDFVKRLNKFHGSVLCYFPVFFRKSESGSPITQILLLISKDPTGINRIRKMFTEVDKEQDDKGKRNQNFYFEDGRMTVYVDKSRNQTSLFPDEENFDKYKGILKYIGASKDEGINVPELLKRIDNACIKRSGYMSGYTAVFLKRALTYFESKKQIIVDYRGRTKRRGDSWGEKAYFYRNTKEDSHEDHH